MPARRYRGGRKGSPSKTRQEAILAESARVKTSRASRELVMPRTGFDHSTTAVKAALAEANWHGHFGLRGTIIEALLIQHACEDEPEGVCSIETLKARQKMLDYASQAVDQLLAFRKLRQSGSKNDLLNKGGSIQTKLIQVGQRLFQAKIRYSNLMQRDAEALA